MSEMATRLTERRTHEKTTGNSVLFFLGVPTSQHGQDVPTGPAKSPSQRHQLGIALLRAINTAELVEQSNYGSYSSWQTLLSHNPKYFDQFIQFFAVRGKLPNTAFGDVPEILPGWNLRMNVHADGQGYDVLLRDMTEKCGYALVTDENAVIREGKAIGCIVPFDCQ